MTRTIDRRAFLGRSAALAGGALLSSAALERLTAREALAKTKGGGKNNAAGYGELAPVPDQRGIEVLALPAGFSYVTFGYIAKPMSDGNGTPLALDGMAAFAHPDGGGKVRLIRNHEDRNGPGAGSVAGDAAAKYDPLAGGGTTTLDYDPTAPAAPKADPSKRGESQRLVQDFVSINGTTVNCAGGIGLGHRSWITCEETVVGPENSGFAEKHGYCYEVPLGRGPNQLRRAEPIRAMGRFAHEALAVDQRTGIVYLTEDAGSGRGSGFYRYLPNDPGNLSAGGRLQMLGVRERPQYDARDGERIGKKLPVEWLEIDEPDPLYEGREGDPDSTFNQGFGKGGAKFNRLEGCWYDEGSVFFVSTSGGNAKNGDVNSDGYREGYGQVWEYRTHGRSPGQLILQFESPGADVLDSPDNLTITPRGGLMLCEDDAGSNDGDIHPLAPGIVDVNRLVGLSPEGEAFEFAVNRLSDSELAGACFSPDGQALFVNIFGDSDGTREEHAGAGMTCAITGPWGSGPL